MSGRVMHAGWIAGAAAMVGLSAAGAARGESCYPDCDESGQLDFFDFLCFQNQFALQSPYADCDSSGSHDFLDFLCFQDAFAAGCSTLAVVPLGVEVAPPLLCGVEVVAFPPDTRPMFTDVTTVESPLGGEVVFDIACNIRSAACGWRGCWWGRRYYGPIYYTSGASRVELTLPPSAAFYFYAIPNPFVDIEFEVAARRGGERASVRDVISGAGFARGFGICGGGEVVVIETDGLADFAFGEFSIGE